MRVDKLLTINKYSRPGIKLEGVKGIVVHWVANPNTTAIQNISYFNSLKDRYASAHFVIDLNGDIYRCIPEDEIAYHVGANKYKNEAIKRLGDFPNYTTLGIECTHIDWSGRMTNETYNSLVLLCVDLCRKYNLKPFIDLYRHYDITGKNCHKWFVDNTVEWEAFKNKVMEAV